MTEKNDFLKNRKNVAVILNFNDDPEMFELLNRYRKSIGWTWKRSFLMGFANTIAKNGDNPDLVVKIADYLEVNR